MQTYIDPDPLAERALLNRNIEGAVVMLNLLRFRKVADYSAAPELAPAQPISGAEAFDRYILHTLPFLIDHGAVPLFLGDGGPFLIGPDTERWDRAMLIRQRSVQSFMEFISDKGYLSGVGHRTAALEDSRLLPLVPNLADEGTVKECLGEVAAG